MDGGKTWADQMDAIKHLHAQKYGNGVETLPSDSLQGITSIIKSDHILIFVGEHGMFFLSFFLCICICMMYVCVFINIFFLIIISLLFFSIFYFKVCI